MAGVPTSRPSCKGHRSPPVLDRCTGGARPLAPTAPHHRGPVARTAGRNRCGTTVTVPRIQYPDCRHANMADTSVASSDVQRSGGAGAPRSVRRTAGGPGTTVGRPVNTGSNAAGSRGRADRWEVTGNGYRRRGRNERSPDRPAPAGHGSRMHPPQRKRDRNRQLACTTIIGDTMSSIGRVRRRDPPVRGPRRNQRGFDRE